MVVRADLLPVFLPIQWNILGEIGLLHIGAIKTAFKETQEKFHTFASGILSTCNSLNSREEMNKINSEE